MALVFGLVRHTPYDSAISPQMRTKQMGKLTQGLRAIDAS